MRSLCKVLVLACLIPGIGNAATKSELEDFNKALDVATRHMDNAAVMALWDDDGVTLLPSMPPMVGKKAIGKFLDDVTAQYPGNRMEKFEMQCHDLEASGDWGSEWCTEHQIVVSPGGKPSFEGWGKMLFVLHRGEDGKWRIKAEMWNQGVAVPAVAH
jgi:ketosteroid isomerase-like protein